MSFDQDPNEQANISGADLAILIDELKTARNHISKANTLISMQAEALSGALDELMRLRYESYDKALETKLSNALSASAESVAAWEAEKLEPLRREVAMLRVVLDVARNGIVWYSENSDDADDSDTEMLCDIDAALTNTQATAEAYERKLRAKVLEEAQMFCEEEATRIRLDDVRATSVAVMTATSIAHHFKVEAAELRAQSAQNKESK